MFPCVIDTGMNKFDSCSKKTTIVDTIRKKRLQWFGHLNRLHETSYVKRAYKQHFEKKRPRGRPPKQWADQIKSDTRLPLLTAERNCQDRVKWKKSTMENVARFSGGYEYKSSKSSLNKLFIQWFNFLSKC